MEKFILTLTLVLVTTVCHAEVWVVHKNGSVYSLSEQNDSVVPTGYQVKILKGKIEDLSLSRPLDEYIFDGTKFKPNTVKIKEREDALIAEEQKRLEEAAARQAAIDKLKGLGLTEAEISALIK